MKKEILNKIKLLGGDISQVKDSSLQADFAAISFKHPLYETDFGESLYGIDAFFDANKPLYLSSKESFYNALMAHFYADIKTPYGQMLFRNTLFTPFLKGTIDFDEWNQYFIDENQVNLSIFETVTSNKKPNFMYIAFNYGWPESFFVCLSDNNPENPTVFGHDRSGFLGEIEQYECLEDFFDRFITKETFLTIVQNYIENEKSH